MPHRGVGRDEASLCYLESRMQNEVATQQRYLGKKGLVIFLAALTAFPALSTDLYLPALPGMTEYFNVPEYQTNLTLILFFVVYAVSMLVWGPLSDRYGRKPVLLVGLSCYTVAGVLCAVAGDVFQLMAFRVLQALGSGAAVATATAIVKDVYHGRRREVILAVIQTMTVLSPAVAPVIGALILRFTSWRGAFVAQAILGLLVVAGSAAYTETIVERLTGNPLASLRRLGVVARNRAFLSLILIFSLLGMAMMAFVSGSSYIYQVTFGVSSQVYSLFFAIFAVSAATGAQLYVLLSRRVERERIITWSFVFIAISGLLVLLIGPRGPWAFILTFLLSPIAFSCSRPPAAYLMLSQHEGDAGSVAGIMSASHMAISSIGMVIISLELWGRVELLGALILGLSVVSLILWLIIGRPLVRAQART
ncbi:MAG: multidrug effflux MFS transporter [Thermoleophilia bacterium]|nr:multidrug effflux MFS transporter [Thermoleophilia bacterium]